MRNIASWKYSLLFVFISTCLFLPFLGSVHLFDWDEINFAEAAREMIETGDYLSVQINYIPFHEKPPLFIWMQALSMHIFGVNEFAARFPNALCGIITLVLLFRIGSKIYDNRFGLLWSLCFAGSLLPHLYFRSGIIDPWFNLFIFLGILGIGDWGIGIRDWGLGIREWGKIVLSGIFIGLAILTKGPVAMLIFCLCILVFWIIKKFKKIVTIKHLLLFFIVATITGSTWFIIQIFQGRQDIVIEFIKYQIRLLTTGEAGHGQPFYYHFVVLLIGCFPVSALFFGSFRKSELDNAPQRQFKLWMQVLFWTTLLLFSIVKTKIVHYSSLCYFPLTYLGAYALYYIYKGETFRKKYVIPLLYILALIIGLALSSLQFIDKYKAAIIASDIIKDTFAVANLRADVSWSGYEFLVGIFFLTGIFFCLHLLKRGRDLGGVGLLIITLITVSLTILIIPGKIEQYSQRAAIEFFISKQNEDCYVETAGYKSYAQYFYTQKKKPANPMSNDMNWLLTGNIDKPAYFVSKITDADGLIKRYPGLKELYRKNGFVFLKREVSAFSETK